MSATVPDMAIGSEAWPGLGKLLEECGELQQVIGKLIAYPSGDHPDGAGDLRQRLQNEMGDLRAALTFVAEVNGLDIFAIRERKTIKLDRFHGWHQAERRVADAAEVMRTALSTSTETKR